MHSLRTLTRLCLSFVLVCLAFVSQPAAAALTIEVVGGGENPIPIAIVPFRSENGGAQALKPVIGADLVRSGLFRSVDAGGVSPLPFELNEINFPQWKARGADAVVVGNVTPRADGLYDISFRLVDVARREQLAGLIYGKVTPANLRKTAHHIADVIYEKLTGVPGVFATRITYVVKRGTRYELQVADADGYGAETILKSSEPIISPAWSPDGTRLAYVSFEHKKPVVYVQSVTSGQRTPVANFLGSNSAPAWSPDGRRLAVTLTKDGGSQLYVVSASGGTAATRLTSSGAIDTEANWSPDGQWILFTSDRGGSPQIYRMPASGGQAQRVTFDGTYNVSPRHSPDGKSFVFIQRNGSRFGVAVQDFASRQVQVLTDGGVDESPSFAPNGRMILYASETRGRGILASVSSDGRVKQRFTETAGDVREPAWGPLINR